MKAAQFKSEDEAEFEPKGDTGVFLEDVFDASQFWKSLWTYLKTTRGLMMPVQCLWRQHDTKSKMSDRCQRHNVDDKSLS